jgi:2-C-methyl-D-erythritol 4-phosphate cytidylyltransferase
MNTAVIVAAGRGTRFGSETPKQFLEICGKPVILHTIERFEACPEISAIVLVLAQDGLDRLNGLSAGRVAKKPLTIVTGGRTRSESVYSGLLAVPNGTEIVAVHDGARPLVEVEDISRTIRRAVEDGAACLVAPVTDTIKRIEGDHIIGTLDRRDLRKALTPQAFRFELLMRAFADHEISESATDECYLVEKLGHRIVTVPCSSHNFKITHPEDLILAEAILSSGVGGL